MAIRIALTAINHYLSADYTDFADFFFFSALSASPRFVQKGITNCDKHHEQNECH